MMKTIGQVCGNCHRRIGRLETAFAWCDSVVCGPCQKILSTQTTAAPVVAEQGELVEYETPAAEASVYDPDVVDLGYIPAVRHTTPTQNNFGSMTSVSNSIIVVNHHYGYPPQRQSSGVAAVLSLLIPGLGQFYLGSIAAGIFWFFATVIGYCFFVIPGMILHAVCVIEAATYRQPRRRWQA